MIKFKKIICILSILILFGVADIFFPFYSISGPMNEGEENDNINLSVTIAPAFSLKLSTKNINFGMYKIGENSVASQTVDIYCSVTDGSVNVWSLRIYGRDFEGGMDGEGGYTYQIPHAPAFWVSLPNPQNPGDFTHARGHSNYTDTPGDFHHYMQEEGAGVLTVDQDSIYTSSEFEYGKDILISLSFGLIHPDYSDELSKAPSGYYTTTAIITLYAEDFEFPGNSSNLI